MTERALTPEETNVLVWLITLRGQRAQIRAERQDGTRFWVVVDPKLQTFHECTEPEIGIPTYPAEAAN